MSGKYAMQRISELENALRTALETIKAVEANPSGIFLTLPPRTGDEHGSLPLVQGFGLENGRFFGYALSRCPYPGLQAQQHHCIDRKDIGGVMKEQELSEMIVVESSWQSQFELHLQASGCSQLTLKAYHQDLAHFASWFESQNGQGFEPELITGVDLRLYRQQALENKSAPASFNRRRASLRRLCRWLLETGRLNYDPSKELAEIDDNDPPPRWLSSEQLHRFMRALELQVNGAVSEFSRWQAARDQAICALMLYAGLREAEVCALNWDDIEITPRKGRVTVRNGKGGKQRQVPLSSEARRMVNLWGQLSDHTNDGHFSVPIILSIL